MRAINAPTNEPSADGRVPRADLQVKLQRFQTLQELEKRKLDVKRTKTERDRNLRIREIERKAADETHPVHRPDEVEG